MKCAHSIWAWLVLSGLAVGARPGYLHTVGPAPLRFQEAQHGPSTPLPPLPPTEEPPPVAFPASTSNECSVPEVSVAPVVTTVVSPAPDTNDLAVTPQMLVNYYRSRRDHPSSDTEVVVPFGFVPPVAAAKPASSATYTSK